ncbi:DNA-binding transcriptional regulator Fis [Alkalilimnicola sp. S0819]|uniref:DNA-binding transcriptional regulator Fis n=1 Tax=Alkalilimnicola sp. S0819 TaxID=2613922 RepID=UPI0012614187|nr:DNA-binding transcriptional regulator Fis [Alkalilimnicola sp. S0819]KAB7623029.1 DNA-binding transcriptional regulator Fis [Alkalilimnicola sp. S0819]MPQ17141.1 DNA-binding transcriptional regulator Fis [Alkalilimnicola sp. S0819]
MNNATTRKTVEALEAEQACGVGPIRACVADALEAYFRWLDGHECSGLYRMVLEEVEPPLLEAVLRHCGGNQTRAAALLGINRGTLRKKLQQYGLEG